MCDSNVITSAGNVAAFDFWLHILWLYHGADVANRVARLLVAPPHHKGGQVQYIEPPVPALSSEARLPSLLERAQAHLSEPLSLETVAGVARMSRRAFTRQFHQATGMAVSK